MTVLTPFGLTPHHTHSATSKDMRQAARSRLLGTLGSSRLVVRDGTPAKVMAGGKREDSHHGYGAVVKLSDSKVESVHRSLDAFSNA